MTEPPLLTVDGDCNSAWPEEALREYWMCLYNRGSGDPWSKEEPEGSMMMLKDTTNLGQDRATKPLSIGSGWNTTTDDFIVPLEQDPPNYHMKRKREQEIKATLSDIVLHGGPSSTFYLGRPNPQSGVPPRTTVVQVAKDNDEKTSSSDGGGGGWKKPPVLVPIPSPMSAPGVVVAAAVAAGSYTGTTKTSLAGLKFQKNKNKNKSATADSDHSASVNQEASPNNTNSEKVIRNSGVEDASNGPIIESDTLGDKTTKTKVEDDNDVPGLFLSTPATREVTTSRTGTIVDGGNPTTESAQEKKKKRRRSGSGSVLPNFKKTKKAARDADTVVPPPQKGPPGGHPTHSNGERRSDSSTSSTAVSTPTTTTTTTTTIGKERENGKGKENELEDEGDKGEKRKNTKRKNLEVPVNELIGSKKATKRIKRDPDEGESGGNGNGNGSSSSSLHVERLANGKKKKRATTTTGGPTGGESQQRSLQWSLVVTTTTGKTKPKTKSNNAKRVQQTVPAQFTLGTPTSASAPAPVLSPPTRILRPTIWAASRSELVLVLPELGHSKSYNGITQGSSNYPMVLLDESTAEGVSVEVVHPAPPPATETVGAYPCVRLTLKREFNCAVNELPVGTAVKKEEAEAEGEEDLGGNERLAVPLPSAPPAPPPACIPDIHPPEIEILTASRNLSCPIILVSSKEVFNQAFLTSNLDANTNANTNGRGAGLADEHAYVFWGFFLIKNVTEGGRLVRSSWDMEEVGEGEPQPQQFPPPPPLLLLPPPPADKDKRRVRGVVEWVFDVEWASEAGVDPRPWWAAEDSVFFPCPVDKSTSALGGGGGGEQLLRAPRHTNLRLNLVPTQLADGQEEGSADECMPRGWLCKKCGRLNPKVMMRHRWCGAAWMGCQGEALSKGYAVLLEDARDPLQAPLALPINVWDENRVDVRVADWDDGMRTVKYRPKSLEAVLARRNEEEEVVEGGPEEWTVGEGGILKHVFTCNAEDLQREATPLFARIQEEVCLSKNMGDPGMYFKCDISDVYAGRNGFSSKTWDEAPQSVHDARSLMEFMGRSYGEDGGFTVAQMRITGWVSSGTRKASETVAGKAGTVGMLCLGNDVILTIMPKWGADTPMSVTLVHGDMLLFSGSDFEYSIKRLGTSLLLVGGPVSWRGS